MIILRLLVILFNVGIVGFLVYRLIQVIQLPIAGGKKAIILIGGTLLLLSPFAMFFGIFAPTAQYFLVYPLALLAFVYLIREVR